MANNNQYNDYEYDAYFGGSDFGGSNSAPSFDYGSDALDMDWGAIFDTTPDATDMDWGSLFDTSDATDMDWGSLFDTNDATDLDWGAVFDTTPSFDYSDTEGGAIGTEGGINWADTFPSVDLSEPVGGAVGTEGGVNWANLLPSVDPNELPGGGVGSAGLESQLGVYDQEAGMRTVDLGDQGTQYITDDGYNVTYQPDGTVAIQRPDGSVGYYSQDADKGYYVQYEDPTKEGELVSIFERALSGEGPTRGTFYSGTGADAAVADYADVYGDVTSPVKVTTLQGKDLTPINTTYKGGKTTTTPVNDTRTIIQKITDTIKEVTGGKTGPSGASSDKDALQTLLALLGGIYGLYKGSKQKPSGYQGGIPKYTAQRNLGKGVTYTKAATGGLMDVMAGQPNENVIMMANGGLMGLAAGGRYLRGGTDGMADKLEANIDGKQPARLSHGEFVIPADVVSHLGNGNSEAGADVLYEMMAKVRKARTGNSKQGKEINPRKYTPA